MQDYYAKYEEFASEVLEACSCININKCEDLGSEIENIKTTIKGLNVQDKWQDTIGDGIQTIILACVDSLNDIISSISSSFAESEKIYQNLKVDLENLKRLNDEYQKRYSEMPDRESFRTIPERNDEGKIIGYKVNETGYNRAMRMWRGDVKTLGLKCEDLSTLIENKKVKLAAINMEKIKSKNVAALPSINVKSLLNFFMLPVDEQKKIILEKFGTMENPFLMRFPQNEYADVSLEGGNRTVSTSGCGICSTASALSCALSNAYGSNVLINPRQLLSALKAETGHSPSDYFNGEWDYAWNSFDDTTATFTDVSIIKLSENTTTFTDQTLKNVTDAGGSAVVSLAGRGHVVCVTESDENGKFKVADSGSRHYDTQTVTVNDKIYSASKKHSGTISGKNGAIYMPNNRLSIDTNTGVISGLDATGLHVDSISIAGKTYKASVQDGKIVIDNPDELVNSSPSEAPTKTVSI